MAIRAMNKLVGRADRREIEDISGTNERGAAPRFNGKMAKGSGSV